VNRPLSVLPILEQWDCHHCTACCRETTIPLSPDDVARLRQQGWEKHPDFRGVTTIQKSSLGGPPILAHAADGACVFLTAAGRCRIHEEFGADAKPRACRLFPLQAVATDRDVRVTVRRSCPSAAADRGRPIEAHLPELKRLLRDRFDGVAPPGEPPPLVRGVWRGWDEFHRVTAALERLLGDERWPLVRRVVHGLRFCGVLEECQWSRVGPGAVAELVDVLEQTASNEVGALFQDRQPPRRATARLFRRLGAHFVRCAPGGPPVRTWRERLRSARFGGQLARARGRLPELHPQFPAVAAELLERPLGPLPVEALRPLNRFFEAHAASLMYALADPTAPLVTSFRRLAFAYPMGMWMLRWLAADRPPTADDMATTVVALERGYVLPALGRAGGFLAASGELERLVVWYGR
jgi:lysine-N-methylase